MGALFACLLGRLSPETANILLQLLKMGPEEVLIESTGVIGQRIKKVVESSAASIHYSDV